MEIGRKKASREERYGLSSQALQRLFEYDNGSLTWRLPRKAKMSPDRRGYLMCHIREGGGPYYIHRLVWVYHNGYIPVGLEIDHIDRDRLNNRIENLRVVTCRENMQNRPLGNTGVRGVSWNHHVGKYQARITIDGKTKSLGYSTELEAAKAIRERAVSRLAARHERC